MAVRRFLNRVHSGIRNGINKINTIRNQVQRYIPYINQVANKAIDFKYPGNSVKVDLAKPDTYIPLIKKAVQ